MPEGTQDHFIWIPNEQNTSSSKVDQILKSEEEKLKYKVCVLDLVQLEDNLEVILCF